MKGQVFPTVSNTGTSSFGPGDLLSSISIWSLRNPQEYLGSADRDEQMSF